MSSDQSPSTRARKRNSNACRICRQRKVKCSGLHPCSNCVRRGHQCVFDEAEKKVIILQKHLRALQGRASESAVVESSHGDSQFEVESAGACPDSAASTTRQQGRDNGRQPDEGTSRESHGHLRNRTHTHNSSPWMYLDEALAAVGARPIPQPPVPGNNGSNSDHSAHPGLAKIIIPSKEVIVHLIHSVDFHLNQLLYFFDKETLINRLTSPEVLDLAPSTGISLTVSQAQLLALLALGKLTREKGARQMMPPGDREFWAVEYHMPPAPDMLHQPGIAAETLCMLAYYAEAINRPDLAFLHVGQALRLLNAEMIAQGAYGSQGDSYGEYIRKLQRLEKTASILDQRLAATKSAPLSEAEGFNPPGDNRVVTLPSRDEPPSVALDIGLGISRLTSRSKAAFRSSLVAVNRPVVSANEASTEGLFECLRGTARKLASLEMGSGISESCLRELHLWFCHCIVIITIPTVLQQARWITSETYPEVTLEVQHINELCERFSALGLKMLKRQRDQGFLETFSFFNVDFLTVAFVSLALIESRRGRQARPPELLDEAQLMLQDIALRGNTVASDMLEGLPRMQSALFLQPMVERFNATVSCSSIDTLVASFDGRLLSKDIIMSLEVGEVISRPRRRSEQIATLPNAEAGIPSFAEGPYLDSLGSGEDFSFDMEDLQWLDSVQ